MNPQPQEFGNSHAIALLAPGIGCDAGVGELDYALVENQAGTRREIGILQPVANGQTSRTEARQHATTGKYFNVYNLFFEPRIRFALRPVVTIIAVWRFSPTTRKKVASKPEHSRLNLPANGKRLIYDLGAFGLPEIPYFAAQNLPFTTSGLPLHSHKERMEISHIIKGERVYHVGGTDYHLRGNHVFFTWPGELHGSGSYLHGRGVHFWIQTVIPQPGAPFLGFDADRAAPLLEALWSMPRRQFKADPEMRDIYARLLVICQSDPSKLACIELSALLARWFLLLAAGSRMEWAEEITPDIARALELMSRTSGDHLRIEDLAAAACLSESRFKGKFREQLGVPPGEYLLRRRTEMAADMLARGRMSMTEIALEVGFSSAQHFSATFKKFFGESPAAWLNRQHGYGLLHNAMHGSAAAVSDDDLRPWIDAEGVIHGYVPRSHDVGVHPNN